MAQAEYDLAKENVASTDTLYRTGQERHKIASINKAELLTLKLDAVNARNTLQNAEISLKRAMFSLASFLNFDKNTEIRLNLPAKMREAMSYTAKSVSDHLHKELRPDEIFELFKDTFENVTTPYNINGVHFKQLDEAELKHRLPPITRAVSMQLHMQKETAV